MAFHVGQKVEYVGPDKVAIAAAWGQTAPVHGVTYTIRALSWSHESNEEVLLLNEIRNAPRQWGDGFRELRMNAKFFRPVVERKSETDIGVFREILDRETIRDPKVTTPAHKVTHT